MGRGPKFTNEQKYEISLDLLSGKLSHGEVCRKYNISSACACKLKDRALDLLRQGIGHPAERSAFSSMFLFGESRGVCFMRRAGFGVLRVMGRGSSGFPGRKENIG